jgi:phenylacetate-CoA ligase
MMLLEVLKDWVSLQRTQWMSRDELMRIQAERLHETVIHAYQKVPFYNELYKAANVPVERILEVKDISELPTTTRMDFRKTSLQDRTAVDVDVGSCGVNRTSGTTGVPIRILEEPSSAAYREALMLRFLWAYGVRPLDRIAKGQYMSALARQRHLAENQGLWGLLRRNIVKQQFYTDLNDQYEFLSRSKPDVLIAGTSYCKALAKHCESVGKSLNFRITLTYGDLLDDPTRKLIADSFETEVFDNYGIEEVGGSIAWECPTHSGYHINVESLVVEFLRNGEPVSAGEPGEVYVTCFHRKATPIIRYSTGDRARPVEDPCPCGRGLPLMREIQGRILDFILTTNGQYVSPYMVSMVLTDTVGVEQFKVTQKEDLSIEVRIKTDVEESEAVLRDAQQRCRDLFGATPFEVMRVDKIDTSGQKYRKVESRATAIP